MPFEGPNGIEDLLSRLQARGFEGSREEGRLLALDRRGEKITVEPGGQVELSGHALETAIACRDELIRHVQEVTELGNATGMEFLGGGLNPFATLDELSWLPKRRYAIMRDYFREHGGRLAHHMMKRTATVQANFDYDDERTCAEKVRTAFAVTSIVTALFAASPISEGRANGFRSLRAAIWLETDEQRCGLLPAAFDEDFGFRHYIEWALDVPMFFVVREGAYHPVEALTFRRFMREGWSGQRATLGDWEIHLSTLFPEVRLKRYIEVRGADAGPLPMAFALPALWRGLLDDRDARRAAWELVRGATMSERETLRRTVPREGMAGRFLGKPVQALAVELCRIAAAGLVRLPGGAADAELLKPVHERAAAGRAPAEDMLDDLVACAGNREKLVERWKLQA